MLPVPPTPTQRLASIKLGRDVAPWIDELRAEGLSYRKINNRLAKLTDFEIDTSETSIRTWHRRYVHEQFVEQLEAEVGAA